MNDSNRAPRPGAALGITKETMLFTLPPALKGDESTGALAEATAEVLEGRLAELDRLRIISNIDNLEEALLAILARDFKVDWWDPSYSLEEKRRTVKDGWRVHKALGTKAAVETAISAIYPNTKVLEWWQYGGEPYHFKLDINITNDSIDSEKQRRVLERLNYYKSLRSHNDGVTYFLEAAPAVAKAASIAAAMRESACVTLTLPIPTIKPVVSARAGVVTGLWEAFTASAVLAIPPVYCAASACVRASAGLQEVFVARVALPEIEPPKGVAELRAGMTSAWQESYTTPAALFDKMQTTPVQAPAKGAVVSTEETAQTFINL